MRNMLRSGCSASTWPWLRPERGRTERLPPTCESSTVDWRGHILYMCIHTHQTIDNTRHAHILFSCAEKYTTSTASSITLYRSSVVHFQFCWGRTQWCGAYPTRMNTFLNTDCLLLLHSLHLQLWTIRNECYRLKIHKKIFTWPDHTVWKFQLPLLESRRGCELQQPNKTSICGNLGISEFNDDRDVFESRVVFSNKDLLEAQTSKWLVAIMRLKFLLKAGRMRKRSLMDSRWEGHSIPE